MHFKRGMMAFLRSWELLPGRTCLRRRTRATSGRRPRCSRRALAPGPSCFLDSTSLTAARERSGYVVEHTAACRRVSCLCSSPWAAATRTSAVRTRFCALALALAHARTQLEWVHKMILASLRANCSHTVNSVLCSVFLLFLIP